MNYAMVGRLIYKDWYLHRWAILAAVLGGIASLAVVAFGGKGGFWFGTILVITMIIGAGAHIGISTLVNERKEKTLAFVMTLPVSYREYSMAKLVANLALFLVPWTLIVIGSVALLLMSPSRGLVPYTAIMAVELLVNACALFAVALITESQGAAVTAIVIGNIGINGIGYLVAHVPGIAKTMFGNTVAWSPSASILLAIELVLILLLLGGAFFVQSRKKDFL